MNVVECVILENKWRTHLRKLDSGSYCEDASSEYIMAQKIVHALKELSNQLLAFERAGYKGPQ